MSIIQIKDGIVTPAQITADKNNYDFTGLSGANILRLSSDASRNITGLTALRRSRQLYVCNVGSFDIVLVDESGSSTAGNRFALSSNLTLNPDEGIVLWYDLTSSRWRALSQPQIAGSGTGDVVGPGSATDNAAVRFDGATGKLVQNGVVIISDAGVVTGVTDLTIGGALAGATTIAASGAVSADEIKINDSNDSHKLTIRTTSDLTADRTLAFAPGDADRTVTINNNVTLVGTPIMGEVPAGAIDGANVTFTLANSPVVGFTAVYLNGIRQKLTTHYTIAGAVITMGSAPLGGDILQVDYLY